MDKNFFVYMLASQTRGTLYTGMTFALPKRIWEHKFGKVEGFTQKYTVKMLVWYEQASDAESAIHREKRLKKYSREAKIRLIEATNPEWNDLYEQICQ